MYSELSIFVIVRIDVLNMIYVNEIALNLEKWLKQMDTDIDVDIFYWFSCPWIISPRIPGATVSL